MHNSVNNLYGNVSYLNSDNKSAMIFIIIIHLYLLFYNDVNLK